MTHLPRNHRTETTVRTLLVAGVLLACTGCLVCTGYGLFLGPPPLWNVVLGLIISGLALMSSVIGLVIWDRKER